MTKITGTVAIITLLILGLVGWQRSQTARHLLLDQQLRGVISRNELRPLEANRGTLNPALVALGQALFFDKELSGNRDIACATCHHPQIASSDALPLSIGTGGRGLGAARVRDAGREFVPRHTLDLFNRGLPAWQTMFWDGRVAGTPATGYATPAGDYLPDGLDNLLAAQAMFPVTLRDEMRGGWYDIAGYTVQPGDTPVADDYPRPAGWHDVDVYGRPNELAAISNGREDMPVIWAGIMQRLLAIPAYQTLFRQAYPDTPLAELGFQHAANALAAFQIEAFTFLNTPWDQYLAGNNDALSAEAKAGALLFFGRAGCAGCHSGSLFSDQAYHNIAVPQFGPGRDAFAPLDYGRFHVTGDPADRYAFRTPPLRNVTLTGPWLHNGAYNSLEAVIRHHLRPAESLRQYDARQLPPDLRDSLQNHPVTIDAILATLDPALDQNLNLSAQEIRQLLAFLAALTDPAAAELDHLIPTDVPSGLPVTD